MQFNHSLTQVKQTEEYASLMIRLGVGTFATLFSASGVVIGIFEISTETFALLSISFFSLCLLIFIDLFRQLASIPRRYLTLLIDITFTSLTVYVTINATHVVWLFYIWLYIGYGSRYGKSFLIAAQLISLIQYNIVLMITDSWSHAFLDLIAQMLILVLLPFYLLNLFRRLQIAKLEAQKMTRVKSNFLTSMSHELRTPLNGIIGTAYLMNKTKLSAEQQKLSSTQLYSANLLHSLIDNILDTEKIENEKLTLNNESFSLHETVLSVLNNFDYFSKQNAIALTHHIDADIPEQLIGDKLRISQILLNLISNAFKYTRKGNIDVSITLLSHQQEQYLIKFCIRDTGIGILPEHQEKLFLRYSQFANSEDKLLSSSGLGLSISKELIELMGGELQLESIVNIGSKFFFQIELKASTNKPNQTSAVQVQSTNQTALHCLIVEDDDINAMILEQFLNDLGHQSDRIDNGAQLKPLLNQLDQYDLVFMDLNLPDAMGVDLAQLILEHHAKSIIIALTANATLTQQQNCLELGMQAFLSKPITPTELAKTIKQLA